MINWFIGKLAGLFRKRQKGRSPRWPALRRHWLSGHPACAACGGSRDVTPHHILPVQVRRDLELDESNLISLCEYHGCHLRVGHCYDWSQFNPNVVADAARERAAYRGWIL